MQVQSTSDSQASYQTCDFPEQLPQLITPFLPRFRKLVTSYAIFTALSWILILSETILFFLFFSFLERSSLLALSLSGIILTLFSYLLLRIYFLGRMPEEFELLIDDFIDQFRESFGYVEGVPEHHSALAHALYKLSAVIKGMEYRLYRLPPLFDSLNSVIERISRWWHWQDVHQMREILLEQAVRENVELVKCEPTSLECHASLANAYVTLSTLYADLVTDASAEMRLEKFRETSRRAIEEFTILNHYAPNDPWVHTQLAYSYRDLQMPEEEIQEYETILRLVPGDQETQFKLGCLYFAEGHDADGLRIYEELKRTNSLKAEELIGHYGAYNQR